MLIIDPDEIERRYMAAILAADGFALIQVGGAIEGMVQTMEHDPALIVIAEEAGPVGVQEVIPIFRRLTAAPLMIVGGGGGGGGSEEGAALMGEGDYHLARPLRAPELALRARMLVRRRDPAGQRVKMGPRLQRCAEGPARRSNDRARTADLTVVGRRGVHGEDQCSGLSAGLGSAGAQGEAA